MNHKQASLQVLAETPERSKILTMNHVKLDIFLRCVAGAMLFTSTGVAQISPSQIDSFYSIRYAGQFNGGMLMAENGKVVYQNSFGKADFRLGLPNNTGTQFNLASVTKPITSTAVLQLVEKGKIDLGASLQKYLPDFPYPAITVRHLLTHTSGLPNLELYENLVKAFPDTIISNSAIMPALQGWTKPLPFQPGDKWQYSNTNYDLLCVLIEKISGMNYEAYLRKNIFKPAGMSNSYVINSPVDAKGAIAHVYPVWYTNTYIAADSVSRFKYINYNLAGLLGSTNIITTLSDMLNFDRAFFSGKLLKKQTIELALTPVKLNDGSIFYEGSMDTMLGEGKGSYGMGWSLFEQPDFGKSAGHGGFNYGLATFYFHKLEKNQTIIAFDNTAGSAFGKVITSALYLLNGKKGIEKTNRSSLARIYGTALTHKGPVGAIVDFNNLKLDTIKYYVSEIELNWLGYDFLRAGVTDLAIEVFKINTILFPNSFNVYDSFAEALLTSGNKEAAVVMYLRSLSLNPDNKGAKEALQKIQQRK